MPDTSPLLNLPYIQPSQAQKHVTHNEALRILETVVQLHVETFDQGTPPVAPVLGDRYIVGDAATGDWAGREGQIAMRSENAWIFTVPRAGWQAFVSDLGGGVGTWATFDGSSWAIVPAIMPATVDQIGINTSADATNRLAVSADATLLNHAGAGHQLKVNKNTTTDTASLLFQDNWSGRAEMGLAGEDGFSVKVSADGSAWQTALRTDPATGAVEFPGGGVRAAAVGDVVYYVDGTLGDDSNDGTTAGAGGAQGTGAFATLGQAITVAMAHDAMGHALTIQLADGTYTLASTIEINHALPGAARLTIQGNSGDNTAVTINGTGDLFIFENCRVQIAHCTLTTSGATNFLIVACYGAQITLEALVFGAAGKAHMDIIDATVRLNGACAITGGAQFHARVELAGRLLMTADYTLTGTPNFSGEFLKCGEVSIAKLFSTTFSGAATGQRYYAYNNAMIATGNMGETFLPGDSAGVISQGGRYR